MTAVFMVAYCILNPPADMQASACQPLYGGPVFVSLEQCERFVDDYNHLPANPPPGHPLTQYLRSLPENIDVFCIKREVSSLLN